jgi:KDO2-lipid IV(A) lauroyltransferase
LASRSGLRNAVEAACARTVLGTLGFTPLPLANALARFYAGLLDAAIPRLRKSADRNLTLAYPERDALWRTKTIDGVFASIARLLVSFARFPQITKANVSRWIAYEGLEHYQQAKARGKGILFATAHLGNWELSAYAHALMTEPMNVVVRPLDNPLMDDLVEQRRSLSGNVLLSKRDFARSIFQALRANQPVGILVDQNSSAENGAFVPFFGVPACASLTFAKLAARSGAAVIPGFAIWRPEQSKYVLRFYSPVEITGDAVADTARIQQAIEVAIRDTPDQWLWIHRRWKTRPEGEPGIYDVK